MSKFLISASALVLSVSLSAQEIAPAAAVAVPAEPSPVAVQAIRAAPSPAVFLPAGTEIPLKMAETVTTKGKSWKEGDEFTLTVATPIMLGGYIVIPEGTKAKGRITWLTSRGAFGKSGKMDVEMEYLEMGGRRINLDGSYRQEGDGATLATVGGVIVASVFAGFITGKSGVIPQGRELKATLESDLPVALPVGASAAPAAIMAVEAAPPQTIQPQPQPAHSEERPVELKVGN